MNERQIREALIAYLSKKHDDTAFIKELFVNNFSSRVDLVAANGSLNSFEIKSELDTLRRLPKQLNDFQMFFEGVTVVCASRHVNDVLASSPKGVGILEVMKTGKFKTIKRAKLHELSKFLWLSHLPVSELRELLKMHDLSSSGNRLVLTDRAESEINKKLIREFALNYYKNRHKKIALLKAKRAVDSSVKNTQRQDVNLLRSNSKSPLFVLQQSVIDNHCPRHYFVAG